MGVDFCSAFVQVNGEQLVGRDAGTDVVEVIKRTRATRPGPRSMDVLAWIARVGVATIEPTGRALGLSAPTAYSHVQRLERAGWLDRVPTQVGAPSLLIITRAGLRALGHDPSSAPRPRPRGWAHDVAIAETAAWLATHPEVRWWRHEREFAGDARSGDWLGATTLQRGHQVAHRPDLVADFGTRRGIHAIEIELSVKSRDRLNAIVAGWVDTVLVRERLSKVLYVTGNAQVASAIDRALEHASRTRPQPRRAIQLASYEELVAVQRFAAADSIGAGGAVDAEPRSTPLLGLAA